MRQRVIIVGGGIAGLSAAHELAERGFEVHVYERRTYFGGKAASVWRKPRSEEPFPGKAPQAGDLSSEVCAGESLPGEHGFRFFPGWYRHLPDLMKRIPYQGSHLYFEGATVFDNLVSAHEDLLAWYTKESVVVVAHPPKTIGQVKTTLALPAAFNRLGLTTSEAAFFCGKLAQFLATPEAKRIERFDGISWWDFMEADDPRKSEAFRTLIVAATRTMVAAKARLVSAYSIAGVAVRTLLDLLGTVDQVLNGPTNDVWIDPWIKHLRARGVKFHLGQELDSIVFGEQKSIEELRFTSLAQQNLDRLLHIVRAAETWRRSLTALLPPATPPLALVASTMEQARRELAGAARDAAAVAQALSTPLDDQGLEKEKLDEMATIAATFATELAAAGDALNGNAPLARQSRTGQVGPTAREPAINQAIDFITKALRPAGKTGSIEELARRARENPANLSRSSEHEDTTYFIFALPVEQMAYYVNRSPMLTFHDPSLRQLILLSESTDWMAGIQFYLKEPVDLVPGHIACLDTEWGLTAIESTQFWRDIGLPGHVKAIISVDISAWDSKGRAIRKEAYNCKNREIAKEVWAQLKASLNREAMVPILRDEMLLGNGVEDPRSYFLDENIVDLLDRKKQGSYEKSRSVQFSADELLRRQATLGHESETPYVWGNRLRFNVEPLLINRVGTQRLRPDVSTAVPNLFLAGDYVRTNTDLACMEAANEAGRRAVNALLDAVGSAAPRCKIWKFSATAEVVNRVTSLARLGVAVSRDATGGRLSQVTGVFTEGAGRFASDLLERWRRSDG